MAKNIILVDHEPFTLRRKELFYIDALISRGFNVEVWNINRWFYPEMFIVDTIDAEYVKQITSAVDLKLCLEGCNIQESVFFVESFWKWRTRELFKILSDYGCCTIKMDLYANSTLISPLSSQIKKIFSRLLIPILKSRVEQLLLFAYNKIHKVRSYQHYLSSSSIVNRTRAINHPDYERWRFDDRESIIEGRYAVFCDIYFPYHPDIKNFDNCQYNINGELYQEKLRCFFDYIESALGLPVIIAAHPKADYVGNEFGNRSIIKYETINLVANCALVLMHGSNSISYAVLNNKPIILFSTDEYESNCRWNIYLKLIARTLGLEAFNIDQVKYSNILPRQVDKRAAKEYVYTYLTSKETRDVRNIDTIINLIAKI